MTIEPLNLTHILVIIGMPIIIFFAIHFSLAPRGEKIKRTSLLLICGFNAALYVIYKIAQATDPDFNFNLLTNLPLHFCNINLLLIPLAFLTHKTHGASDRYATHAPGEFRSVVSKTLMAYQVYFGVPLAGLALLTVYPAFISTSIFSLIHKHLAQNTRSTTANGQKSPRRMEPRVPRQKHSYTYYAHAYMPRQKSVP